jgi:dCMP deaminase
MTDWDKRFIEAARLFASWSKDPSTQVGAVIVDTEHRIIGVGYNGFPRFIKDDDRLNSRVLKLDLMVHAELNAILNATKSVVGAEIYVTHPPCVKCASVIIQSGIVCVASPKPTEDLLSRWKDSLELASSLFREASVIQYFVD